MVVEVEEDIETLPPERLLSGGEKIFESLSMSGVEIVFQPPTLRKRILMSAFLHVCTNNLLFLQWRNCIRTRFMVSAGWCICFRKACR